MKLRIKANPFYEVVLDSRYVRWPRPTIRGFMRQIDRRITQEFRRNPDADPQYVSTLGTMIPVVSQRVILNIPF